MGSLFSSRFSSEKLTKVIAFASLAIVAMLILHAFVLPGVLKQLLGLELAVRLLFAFLALVPLGFMTGFPFPLGIRLLGETDRGNYIPWMWGINGISSVLGSALTIAIAVTFGFTQALLLGAVCYFIVFLMFRWGHTKGLEP